MNTELEKINALIEKESKFISNLLNEANKIIVGQKYILERLLIGILAGGNILIEGVPGLAKTLAVKTLAQIVDVKFKRIQFTPDLLPADLIGTLIYDQKKGEFLPKLGPIFANFILADEINRAPAKVQSALLEAMQEKQVTIGENSYQLDEPFLILATQNPIEQEGTYPLPEAQVDRFMLKLKITYPSKEEEKEIINLMTQDNIPSANKVISPEDLVKARAVINQIYVDDKVKEYVLDIVFATREPEKYNLKDLKSLIDYGASPRASIYLIQAAKAHAFIKGRGYVTPEDIKAIGKDVLRHRIIPSFEAEAEEVDSEAIIERVFTEIEVP
ncbi:AAA family ATPase [Candidatus Margulisiibacteriota bacterium]